MTPVRGWAVSRVGRWHYFNLERRPRSMCGMFALPADAVLAPASRVPSWDLCRLCRWLSPWSRRHHDRHFIANPRRYGRE